MQFLAEHHLALAKLVREKAAARTGSERELFIRKSNSLIACVRLSAKDRGGVSLIGFDWSLLVPNWSVIDEQIRRLSRPLIDGPPLVPDGYSI